MTCQCSCHRTLAIVTGDGVTIHQAAYAGPTIEDLLPHDRPLSLDEAANFAQCVLDSVSGPDLVSRAGTVQLARVVVRMQRAMGELALSLEHDHSPLVRTAGEQLRNRMRGV